MSAVMIQTSVEVVKLPRKGQPEPAPGLVHWTPQRSAPNLSLRAPALYQSIHHATTYTTACDKRTDGMVACYQEAIKLTCPDCQVAYAHWVFTVREEQA